ncbi:hypothetical protein [Chryseobacterium taihuense]|nr:hypothetical protein [Chryseobacterium taihuense]
MSKLIGGGWVQTSSSSKSFKTSDGRTCVKTTIDGYNDANGNGKLDKGEVKQTCTDIDCV